MNITKKDIFYIIIIFLILICGSVFYFNKINTLNTKFDNYENTITALNDSIKVTIKNNITEYTKKSPEIYLNDLIKSETFKNLEDNQKKYYLELSKIKGLISSTKAELIKVGSDLAVLKGTNIGVIKNDSICYNLNDTLIFEQTDTSKALKWNGLLTLNKNPTFKLNYKYDVNIETLYERQKDKSILVKYKINDPELKVNNMYNYMIPAEQKRTRLGRWIENNKTSILTTAFTAVFCTGGYIGYKLAK